MSLKYPNKGPLQGYTCPKCKSSNVFCLEASYEFSSLECKDCSFSEIVDDYQIEDWIEN